MHEETFFVTQHSLWVIKHLVFKLLKEVMANDKTLIQSPFCKAVWRWHFTQYEANSKHKLYAINGSLLHEEIICVMSERLLRSCNFTSSKIPATRSPDLCAQNTSTIWEYWYNLVQSNLFRSPLCLLCVANNTQGESGQRKAIVMNKGYNPAISLTLSYCVLFLWHNFVLFECFSLLPPYSGVF